MKTTTSIYQLTFLVVLFAVFAGYNFMFADAPLGVTPPGSNTPAPLNVGAAPQAKSAGLDLGSLVVQGGSIFRATPAISNTAPQIEFDDTSGDNNKWWLHSNAYGSGPRMHFLYDRNNNGAWDDGNASVFVQAGAAVDGSQDILQSNGQTRSRQYCDESGDNCFAASNVRGASCRTESVSAYGVYSNRSRITATCNSDEVVTGGGCNTTATANSLQDFPEGNGWQCYKHLGENTGDQHQVYAMCCKK